MASLKDQLNIDLSYIYDYWQKFSVILKLYVNTIWNKYIFFVLEVFLAWLSDSVKAYFIISM